MPHAVASSLGRRTGVCSSLTLMFGAAFLILADIPGRVLTDPAETPIGIVTAFLGAPFFLVILRAKASSAAA